MRPIFLAVIYCISGAPEEVHFISNSLFGILGRAISDTAKVFAIA